jgi:hypothetical protein
MTTRIAVLATALWLGMVGTYAQQVPQALKTRLVVGEPVWRELPVRPEIQKRYDYVWQTAFNTLLEHNYELDRVDKESGYLRTTWNESLVLLKDNWYYRVKISVKLITAAEDPQVVDKVRLQVIGDVTQTEDSGKLKASFRGYDQVVLQNLVQDLQLKLGLR